MKNRIYVEDCLELMKTLPTECADLTFADPPFNLGKKYNGYNDKRDAAEYFDWCEQWLAEMVRITKSTGSIFVHHIPRWLIPIGDFLGRRADFMHWITWQAAGMPVIQTLQAAHYGILFYAKDKEQAKFYRIRRRHQRDRKSAYLAKDYGGKKGLLHPFGPLVSDIWTDIHRVQHYKHRDDHPCQLPIALLERILLMTTDENDLVIDPFLGTGTTAIAAKKLGRRYIGIEQDKDYAEIANSSVKAALPSSRIGERWVGFCTKKVLTIRDADWQYLSNFFDLPMDTKWVDHVEVKLKRGKL